MMFGGGVIGMLTLDDYLGVHIFEHIYASGIVHFNWSA